MTNPAVVRVNRDRTQGAFLGLDSYQSLVKKERLSADLYLVMSKHVVFFTNSAELFLRQQQHLAEGIKKSGFKVTLICPIDSTVAQVREAGYACETIYLNRKSVNPILELWTLVSLIFLLRRLKPDIMQLFTIRPVVYGSLVARLLGVPLIVNTVSVVMLTPLLRWGLSWIFKNALNHEHIRFVFLNRDDQENYISKGWVQRGQSQVIPGAGVDTSEFLPPKAEPARPVRILYAGRFLKDKGLNELVQACDRLHAEDIPFRLVLCGQWDPSHTNFIGEERMQEILERKFVENLGFKQNMPAVYQEVHVVCLPSYREGFPQALIEAAACGRALVTTDVPGCRDVVTNGQNGFLSEVHSVADLHRALRALILDEDLRLRLGRRSREMALAKFDKTRLVEEGLRVYGEVVEERLAA